MGFSSMGLLQGSDQPAGKQGRRQAYQGTVHLLAGLRRRYIGRRSAVSILTAHKILITTAIIFFLFYAVWEIRNYPDPGGVGALLRGSISGIAACGLGIYLRYFLKSRRLR